MCRDDASAARWGTEVGSKNDGHERTIGRLPRARRASSSSFWLEQHCLPLTCS
jgi:hypothetical protein